MEAVVELDELAAVAVGVAAVGTADCTGRKDCWTQGQKAGMPWLSFGSTEDWQMKMKMNPGKIVCQAVTSQTECTKLELPPELQLWQSVQQQ